MSELGRIIAGHPLARFKPYNAIKFASFHPNGTPLYTVSKQPAKLSARNALALAMKLHGGHCFHCEAWMEPQELSQDVTRDHVTPKSKGGGAYLHNLVFACGTCNRGKAALELIDFKPESGKKYLNALSAHLTRCIEKLAKE
jgi:5-methylcytosine-specific restriction endonuclease McrA